MSANAQKVRERLLEHDMQVEAMGGETQDVEVSALKKIGLDDLHREDPASGRTRLN